MSAKNLTDNELARAVEQRFDDFPAIVDVYLYREMLERFQRTIDTEQEANEFRDTARDLAETLENALNTLRYYVED